MLVRFACRFSRFQLGCMVFSNVEFLVIWRSIHFSLLEQAPSLDTDPTKLKFCFMIESVLGHVVFFKFSFDICTNYFLIGL